MILSEDLVIEPHADGFGDNLLYASIPEIGTRNGRRVFVSTRRSYRNEDIRKLVWECNPWVAGFVNADSNVNWGTLRPLLTGSRKGSPIRRLERLLGFDGVNDFPKVYYQPKVRLEWVNRVVVDPTSISQPFPADHINRFVDRVVRTEGYAENPLFVLTSKHQGTSGHDALVWYEHYETADIFEYADIIYSCKAFLTMDSGGNALASALKGHSAFPDVYTLTTNMSFNDKIFTFPNVTYIPNGITPDYKEW